MQTRSLYPLFSFLKSFSRILIINFCIFWNLNYINYIISFFENQFYERKEAKMCQKENLLLSYTKATLNRKKNIFQEFDETMLKRYTEADSKIGQ